MVTKTKKGDTWKQCFPQVAFMCHYWGQVNLLHYPDMTSWQRRIICKFQFRLTFLNRLLPTWLSSLSVTILVETKTWLLEPIAVLHWAWLTQANVVVSIASSQLENRQRNVLSSTNCCDLCGFINLIDFWRPKLDINDTSQNICFWCTGRSSPTSKSFAHLDVGNAIPG